MIKFLIVAMMMCSCVDNSMDKARKAAAQKNIILQHCNHVTGDGVDLSICTDGRRLVICSTDDGCMYVNLDPESLP
jgi:hypothetical protein